ncbi:MAG TPA: 2Fe-2S iron-sulfur cluster-binding protein [Verrucomicrobiae bacterium]|jgi:2Fe-2S ferredoxin|nr:2Fe-2S iron-sulfur cluster-binding protein [Verrucomicrobiae bacterium]
MPKVTWVLGNGKEITAEVPVGHNMMEAAVAHNVPDVIGECGGCLSCATCHVFVDPAWFAKTGGPSEMESDMLEITMVDRQATSRLSCQIISAAELDGLILKVPRL